LILKEVRVLHGRYSHWKRRRWRRRKRRKRRRRRRRRRSFFSRKYCDCEIFFHRVTNLVTTLFPCFLGSYVSEYSILT
jgi:hypothetical protein